MVDTRTFLWEEMRDDFSLWDWVVGRGALGVYYSPYFDMINHLGKVGDWMYRQVNEIGYLHIVLKAGVVGVLFYVSVFLFAIKRSLALADKRLGIGIAIVLALHLIELIIIGQPSFSMQRVLLWILVGYAIVNGGLNKNEVRT